MINNYFIVMVKKIIKNWSPMQTEKCQPSGQRIMPERGLPRFRHYPLTRGLEFFTTYPALSVDPRVGISRSASETNNRIYFKVDLY